MAYTLVEHVGERRYIQLFEWTGCVPQLFESYTHYRTQGRSVWIGKKEADAIQLVDDAGRLYACIRTQRLQQS
jgi:hypothetical protein